MKIKISVPATTANLGAGFDTFGLALNLFNEFIVEESNSIEIETIPKNEFLENPENNLFVQVLKKSCEYFGNEFHGVKLTQKINVPVARGLGSSATAIVAAIMVSAFVNKKELTDKDFFTIAYEFEPHPDNLLPAWKGGFTIALKDEENTYYQKLDFPREIKAVVAIPDFQLSTEEARKVLPESIPLKDGIFNVQRASLFVSAVLTKRLDLLKVAMDDRFHQPYRKKLIPGFDNIIKSALEKGAIGASLSGAGPTILALATENFENIGKAMVKAYENEGIKAEYKVLDINQEGAKIEII